MNAMYTSMYLFVVYFSFGPVISATIHRYVNYSDIHVLMMVTETETLTSTLNHNKFPYLDYVFLLPLYIYRDCKTRKTNSDFCLNFCLGEANTKVKGIQQI